MKIKFLLIVFCLAFMTSCIKDKDVVKTMYVGEALVPCDGVGHTECMQVKFDKNETWKSFYGSIEGFNFKEGHIYKLKVSESKVEDPAADVSALKYTLIEVLEDQASKSPNFKIGEGSWEMVDLAGVQEFERKPFITITPDANRIHGSTSCNKFNGFLSLEHGAFKTKDIAVTKMACRDLSTEDLFLKTLNKVAAYKIEGDYLMLRSDQNEVLMTFQHLGHRE